PTHHKQHPYHRQKRAQNVSDGLNQPKHIKPLPDAKNRVRKRLSAFLESKKLSAVDFHCRDPETRSIIAA
ncbi:TPA: hypothetical protein ACV46Q_005371, partial [Escherichia coli]